MSKIHFLTQKGKLLSLGVINRVQQIIDRAAMKFTIRRVITSAPLWVSAVGVGESDPEHHGTSLAERSQSAWLLQSAFSSQFPVFKAALKVELVQ